MFCYAEVPVEDATTARLRGHADHWRSTIGRSDAEVAEMIRRDAIDVLVDLAGHTAGNRLLVFARRPAPVQISYMLGTGSTSGLSAIDAFIADDSLAPPGSDHLFSEQVIRFPRIPLAYRPPPDMPAVASLPALRQGRVTFGYFGRTVRLNDLVIAAWSRLLAAVPGSQLVLNSAPFAEPASRAQFAARFAAHGISRDRLDLIFTTPQPTTWAAYAGIDIALDPFPHNAGTTTIEALWQGVPVLVDGRPAERRPDRGKHPACPRPGRLGGRLPRRLCRPGRRGRGRSDPPGAAACRTARAVRRPPLLADAAGLARAVEQVCRMLWDAWCAAPSLECGGLSGELVTADCSAGRDDEADE